MEHEISQVIGKLKISKDSSEIAKWSQDALDHGLFREDGLAQFAFRGEQPIYAMIYIPHIAWVCWHGTKYNNRIVGSIFVHPDLRRRGIGTKLQQFAMEQLSANPIFPINQPNLKKSDSWK